MTNNERLSRALILVVEDDENNLIIVSRLLALAGASPERIYKAENYPAECIEGCEAGIDLVLLDLHLPDKDGYQVIKELQADRKFASAKIVALTANALHDDTGRARTAGFHGFIGKPIDARAFGPNLERILSGEEVWEG